MPTPAPPPTVFEVAWEIANKVGGVHGLLSTKARRRVERLGNDYVCVGPWRLTDPRRAPAFEDEAGFEGFAESCRSLGVPVRVGRWLVPGRPRAVLVDSSAFFGGKDAILARLWDRWRVDSLHGGWDYVEPLLFGCAAGIVVERWWHEHVGSHGGEAVLHAHDAAAAAALLHARDRLPAVGTVFHVHATAVGRALGRERRSLGDGLDGRTPDQAAEALGVRSRHSLEVACAREADVLAAVSDVGADEVAAVLGRAPSAVLRPGIDLQAFDALATTPRADAQAALRRLARAFLGDGTRVDDAVLVGSAGRADAAAKGFDVFVDALRRVGERPGPPVVAFLFAPVGVSSVRRDLAERLRAKPDTVRTPLAGVATHVLFEGDADAIGTACAAARLDNAPSRRARVIHVADVLFRGDGLLDLPFEAALRGLDFACFPAWYEPWGYSPSEALAAGVPVLASDRAGFGRWAASQGLSPADGVAILGREGRPDADVARDLANAVDRFAAGDAALRASADRCRASAARLSLDDTLALEDRAYDAARARARDRALGAASSFQAPAAGDETRGTAHLRPDEIESALPPSLRGLARLARNLRWTWDLDAPALFATLGGEAWEACRHNPVALLADAPASDLFAEARDPAIVERVRAAVERVEADLSSQRRPRPAAPATSRDAPGAGADGHVVPASTTPLEPQGSPWPPLVALGDDMPAWSVERPVAYFCAEFGIHESLPVYNGGLGILAGDHLKAAHDERVPLVGVGLLYRHGFLRQHVTVLGDQVPLAVENEPRDLPLELVRDAGGAPVKVALDLPATRLALVAWRADVGDVPLYLLDADLPENRPEDRAITHRLYAGDLETRLRQEIVLGKGGARLLARLGIEPAAIHLNEGHAAFAPLERVSRLVHQAALSFEEAAAVVRATTAFTTHTPIPAGHDRFPEALVRRYFADCAAWVGLSWERFFALGRAGSETDFNMTTLGLRMSGFRNGVSRLHGSVSRRLLGGTWPGLLEDEVPVGHVTNGVHLPTWTAPSVARLFAKEAPVTGDDFASRACDLDEKAVWGARREARARLLAEVRRRVAAACAGRREPPESAARLTKGLTDDALVIGFARRFATYKRADLLLRDLPRLVALLSRDDRPVRLLFAGKAHPADRAGQDVLRAVVTASRSDALAGKLVFLDDYDAGLARAMVEGVDAWLNTPIRTLEASGTSGMKAACNGALHVSVKDGWWDEAFDGKNGFAVGDGAPGGRAAEDALDAAALYRVLEDDVLPAFFERDGDGLPRRWLERMKDDFATIPKTFDARRMVREYADRAYAPLAESGAALTRRDFGGAKEAAVRHVRLRRAFSSLRVANRRPADLGKRATGESVDVVAEVDLAGLSPSDVVVDSILFGGADRASGRVAAVLAADGGTASPRPFRATVRVPDDGRTSLAVRVRPRLEGPGDGGISELVLWG